MKHKPHQLQVSFIGVTCTQAAWGGMTKVVGETYGAALVFSKMCLFLRSCGSGRCCKCFSRELRRSTGEMGEMGLSSMEGWSGSMAIFILGGGERL